MNYKYYISSPWLHKYDGKKLWIWARNGNDCLCWHEYIANHPKYLYEPKEISESEAFLYIMEHP